MESQSYISTGALPPKKKKKWIYVVGTLVFLVAIGGAWFAATLDWDSLGPAVPPDPPQTFSNDLVNVLDLQIEGVNVLESPLALAGARWVDNRGNLETKVDAWQWSPFVALEKLETHEEIVAYVEAHKHLPRMKLRLQWLVRSSKSPGYVVVWETGVQDRPLNRQRVSFQGRLWVPGRPGTYELRLIVNKMPYDRKTPPDDPTDYVVASTHITVVPADAETQPASVKSE